MPMLEKSGYSSVVTATLTKYNMETKYSDFIDPGFFNTMFCYGQSFGVASRNVSPTYSGIYYGIFNINNYTIGERSMFYSGNDYASCEFNLRPVVLLDNNVEIEQCTGTNSPTNMHKIKY